MGPCKRLHLVWLRLAHVAAPSHAGAGALGPRLVGRLTAELVLRSPQYMSCVKYYEIDLRGRGSAFQRTKHVHPCAPRTLRRQQPLVPSAMRLSHAVLSSLVIPGNKITAIENLGATEVSGCPAVACTVLIDQAIARLSPGPCLLCPVQNQFDSIDLTDNAIVRLEGFPKLPRLKMLLLSNNRIVRIAPHLEGETAHAASLMHKQQQAARDGRCTGRQECTASAGDHLVDACCRAHPQPRVPCADEQQAHEAAGMHSVVLKDAMPPNVC